MSGDLASGRMLCHGSGGSDMEQIPVVHECRNVGISVYHHVPVRRNQLIRL